MAGVILLPPSGLAQTQGEHGGDELHGGHADHDDDDDVDLVIQKIVNLSEAALRVGVFARWIFYTSRVGGCVRILSFVI